MPTLDVDVFVQLNSSDSLIADPTPIFAFFAERGHEMDGEYVVVDGWPVQFLGPPGALGEDALESAVTVESDGLPVRVLSAEYLAALALQSGRPKDKVRVLSLLDSAGFNRNHFEGLVAKHGLEAPWRELRTEFDIR
jgi:hypothetical protein